jgi:hypothetical protein
MWNLKNHSCTSQVGQRQRTQSVDTGPDSSCMRQDDISKSGGKRYSIYEPVRKIPFSEDDERSNGGSGCWKRDLDRSHSLPLLSTCFSETAVLLLLWAEIRTNLIKFRSTLEQRNQYIFLTTHPPGIYYTESPSTSFQTGGAASLGMIEGTLIYQLWRNCRNAHRCRHLVWRCGFWVWPSTGPTR